MSAVLKVARDGAVVMLTIDDPKTKNALSPALTRQLVAACNEINADMSVGCAILTGANDVFCAGGNIKDMYARANHFAGNAAEIRRTYQNGVQTIARALYDLEVPIIAAVNGAAMGAGMDFATMCTIRIASETAKFAESFIKLGLTSAAGGAWSLNRAIGTAAAAEMALTGDTIDAARALEIGLISRIVAPDALLDEARALAARITRHPPHSIRLNTRLLRESARLDLGTSLEIAAATPDVYHSIVRINMDGVYWGCAAAARAMNENGGTIINVSSNAADDPTAGLSIYAMTKSAVNMLTRSLALELGPRKIRVNAVAPGFILTPLTDAGRLDPEHLEASIARNAQRSPIGAVGDPADIAHAMLYLASDASKFVTGQILRVNGGAAMPG